MVGEDYVLDCTLTEGMDGLLCFVPVTYDESGEVESFVVGMNYLSTSPPPGGRFIGVIHADGQDALDAWCAENQQTIDRLLAEREEAAT